MVFPDGIGYDFKNKLVQTFRINEIFSAICSFSENLKETKKGDFLLDLQKIPFSDRGRIGLAFPDKAPL